MTDVPAIGDLGRVDVVAIEAQAGFKPQRVPRAEADGFDAVVAEQSFGEGFGVFGRRPESRIRPHRYSRSA